MTYYPRQIESSLRKATAQFRVVVLTGARQTGKSTLLEHLFKKTHHCVSLDNPRCLKLAQHDPEAFFEEYPAPLILDEIQYAPELLRYIKIRADRSQKKGQYILTGSQQFTMMKNLQETLAGRAVLFSLLPMSIEEGSEKSRNYFLRASRGSYPELIVSPSSDAERWFASYLSTYIEKDVQPHYQLEKITHFRDFIFLLASRTAQILNYHSLASDLGVSIHAVKLWLKILEASNVIYLLRPYYVNLGSRLVKSPKVYFTDVGFVNYLLGNRDKNAFTRGPQAGAIFENFVLQEVLKRFTNQGLSAPLFYYRTNNGLEVDLIIEERRGVIRTCEIKLTQSPDSHMAQPIDRLTALNQKGKVSIVNSSLVCLSKNESFPITRAVRGYNLSGFLRTLRA